jgi:hypothetical protein
MNGITVIIIIIFIFISNELMITRKICLIKDMIASWGITHTRTDAEQRLLVTF